MPVCQIQNYNFETSEKLRVGAGHCWYSKISADIVKGKPNCIFLDEMQAIPGFENLLTDSISDRMLIFM